MNIYSILAVINLVDMVVYHSGLSPAILTLVNSKYHGATELTPSPVGALLQTVVRRLTYHHHGYTCLQLDCVALHPDESLHDQLALARRHPSLRYVLTRTKAHYSQLSRAGNLSPGILPRQHW